MKTHVVASSAFSLTQNLEGVKRHSFFDTFLSFSGWCGVRGSSEVTFLIERLGRRVSEGLSQSAGRGEREDQVKGRIEFRGVGLVYPVGGEPGAQARSRVATRKEATRAGR